MNKDTFSRLTGTRKTEKWNNPSDQSGERLCGMRGPARYGRPTGPAARAVRGPGCAARPRAPFFGRQFLPERALAP